MSLVNVSLKLWSLKYGIYANIFAEKNVSSFCICKSYSHFFSKCKSYSHFFFFSKNTGEWDIVPTRTFNILTTNELVKLTMLWTTWPWCFIQYEPEHDKINKMACAPSEDCIRPVWLESSLRAQWVAKDPSFLYADSEILIRLGCPDWSESSLGALAILLV